MKTSTLMALVSFMYISNSVNGETAFLAGLVFAAGALYGSFKEEKESEKQV